MFDNIQDALNQLLSGDRHESEVSCEQLIAALKQFPHSAELYFLLGSEQAEAGNKDDAKSALGYALVLKPDMHIARFQLAFLHLLDGNFDAVKVLLEPLVIDVGAADYLTYFAKGCIAAAEGDTEICVRQLEAGINHNRVNEALNTNMKKLCTLLMPSDVSASSEEAVETALFDIYTQQKH
ncbi:tetratricopeptide repeat protein [Rheinheimera aquimaris]|jgi:tetratricopeptide (TPR) repeat protein|uniref:tetratricopeptide repeat protein n=1 Tax=Rheinheimera aquimaris TaxID=412437 RepID=UPI001E52A9B9|nr:hypothetical protein [Rheinheimera aquimaris]MCD1600474.1 hypothetical protein [Rheinheimera aquimaris]